MKFTHLYKYWQREFNPAMILSVPFIQHEIENELW